MAHRVEPRTPQYPLLGWQDATPSPLSCGRYLFNKAFAAQLWAALFAGGRSLDRSSGERLWRRLLMPGGSRAPREVGPGGSGNMLVIYSAKAVAGNPHLSLSFAAEVSTAYWRIGLTKGRPIFQCAPCNCCVRYYATLSTARSRSSGPFLSSFTAETLPNKPGFYSELHLVERHRQPPIGARLAQLPFLGD